MSGDFTQVSKNKYCDPVKAFKAWERIFNQHIKAHGLPDNYVQYVAKMVKVMDLYNKVYQGQKWQIVKARVYEVEAEELLKGESERIEKTCARISKFMGFPVKAETCTASEFYSYLDIMKN